MFATIYLIGLPIALAAFTASARHVKGDDIPFTNAEFFVIIMMMLLWPVFLPILVGNTLGTFLNKK